jgi:MFS family permease
MGGIVAMLAGALVGAVAGGILGGRIYGHVGRWMFALTFAVVGVLAFEPPDDPRSHAILGPAYGVVFGLACGCVGVLSRAWEAYAVSRIWLALRGEQPWRLMRFLDDAHRRGMLRQSGATYQFRHARVQDHLAHADPPNNRKIMSTTGRYRIMGN